MEISLNESILKETEEFLTSLEESYEVFIVNSKNEDKLIKSGNKTSATNLVEGFISDNSRLDDLDATQLYVIDKSKENNNELFIYTKDEKGWNVDFDKLTQ